MEKTVADRVRRGRQRCAQAGGLLLAFALIGLSTACSREPSAKHLRTQATSPEAEARRVAGEQRIRALIEHLTAVDGLEHVLTRLTDSCNRPNNGSIFENNRSPDDLTCSMQAVAYFGVPGDIGDVLVRVRAAGIAAWGPQDDQGRDVPSAAGTVSYALDYHRDRGRYPDGTLMPAPTLEAPGLRIDWDRPDLPLPHQIQEPGPCPQDGSGGIYLRCSTVPQVPIGAAAARARYGTVLTLALHLDPHYFTVPRQK
ncbi:hypothetical protein [Streptomyces sp. H39-S7]|uniref:hypothetical protein n=1 Tax=Streptomyces sp. H39-S7 TaxID=3004357 RepID=UPI0022B046DF|nr:hypothetical protein [Streptomyces sp. H39-S7]MCZ4123455.1 hypothetical protein [Streptomyces sp. H39-S7]